jgi:hypothetical protein
MDCVECGKELSTTSNYFIVDIGHDLLWECTCGQKYEVDHYCEEDGCYEDILPVKEST